MLGAESGISFFEKKIQRHLQLSKVAIFVLSKHYLEA